MLSNKNEAAHDAVSTLDKRYGKGTVMAFGEEPERVRNGARPSAVSSHRCPGTGRHRIRGRARARIRTRMAMGSSALLPQRAGSKVGRVLPLGIERVADLVHHDSRISSGTFRVCPRNVPGEVDQRDSPGAGFLEVVPPDHRMLLAVRCPHPDKLDGPFSSIDDRRRIERVGFALHPGSVTAPRLAVRTISATTRYGGISSISSPTFASSGRRGWRYPTWTLTQRLPASPGCHGERIPAERPEERDADRFESTEEGQALPARSGAMYAIISRSLPGSVSFLAEFCSAYASRSRAGGPSRRPGQGWVTKDVRPLPRSHRNQETAMRYRATCFRRGEETECTVPPESAGSAYNSASGAIGTACDIREGRVRCWPSEAFVPEAARRTLEGPAGVVELVAAIPRWFAVRTRDGQIWTFHAAERDVVDALAHEPIDDAIDLAASWDELCVLRRDGSVRCWGGRGMDATAHPSEPIQGVPPLASIAAGSHHFCGLTQSGEAWCWGRWDGYGATPPTMRIEPFDVPLDAH